MFESLRNLFQRQLVPVSGPLETYRPSSQPYPWFAEINDDQLEQGDIFEDCPTYLPPDSSTIGSETGVVRWAERDLILLSQSCDLVKGREKISQACLCEVWRRSEFRPPHFLAEVGNLEMIRKGQIPRYHLLAPSQVSGLERELRIVDLQQVYSLPIDFLRARALTGRRLRLLPPYREHLSQAFARVFMRVGLPIDIPPLKKK